MSLVLSLLSAASIFWLGALLFTRLEQSVWSRRHLSRRRLNFPWPLSLWQIRKRELAVRLQLPLFMDLLSVSVAAGLDWIAALTRMTQWLPRMALTEEFEKMLTDCQLGKSRKAALIDLQKRLKLKETGQFVGVLIQTLQLGSPMSPVLEANARQMREMRFRHAERLGYQAGLKILIPLIFCILPSVFLLIFAPLGLRLWQEGWEGLL